jgi:hypothetical protein
MDQEVKTNPLLKLDLFLSSRYILFIIYLNKNFMLMLGYFTIPNPTEVLSSSSVWFNALFTEFSSIIYMVLGIVAFIGITFGIINYFRK